MCSSIPEKSDIVIITQDIWGVLHRAGLDNIHIEMCLSTFTPLYKYYQLNQEEQDKKATRDLLVNCGLPQIPLDQVMRVLFP